MGYGFLKWMHNKKTGKKPFHVSNYTRQERLKLNKLLDVQLIISGKYPSRKSLKVKIKKQVKHLSIHDFHVKRNNNWERLHDKLLSTKKQLERGSVHLFDLFYKISSQEFGKVVFSRNHCMIMKTLKFFAYFFKIVYEPLILFSLKAHEYYFYEGKDQSLYHVLCYVQTGFVLVVSLYMQRAIIRLAYIGFYHLQIKINLNKRLLECCDTNNIGKNV